MATAKTFPIKMTFWKPAGGDAKERENAMVTDRDGGLVCLWDVTEPEILQHFGDRDHAYFLARQNKHSKTIEVIKALPDEDW